MDTNMANSNHPVQWEQIAQHLEARQYAAGSVSHTDEATDPSTLAQASFIWEKSAKLCPVSEGKKRAIGAIMGKCQSASGSTQKINTTKRNSLFLMVSRYAASVAVLLLAGWATYYYWPNTVQSTFEAPEHTGMVVQLTDGTQIWLKAGSSITLSDGFPQTNRNVQLDGDAFFEVAHNPSKPFVITQEEYAITVLGTSFDVSYSSGFAQVAVRTGKVRMENTDTQEFVELLPGEVGVDEGASLVVNSLEPTKMASWIQESPVQITFDKTALSDVTSILQTTFGIQIEVSTELANRKLTASFSGGRSIESILETITKATGSSLRKEGVKYVIE